MYMYMHVFVGAASISLFDEVSEIGLASGLAAGGVVLLLLSVTVGFICVRHRRNSGHKDHRYAYAYVALSAIKMYGIKVNTS